MGEAASTKTSKEKGSEQAHRHPGEQPRLTESPGMEAGILGLQRTVGNRAVGQLLNMAADRTTANANVLQRKCASCGGSRGQCSRCNKEDQSLQLKAKKNNATPSSPGSAPPIVHSVLNSGSGSLLDPSTREFMESRFGHDFGQVRVHTDAKAAQSTQAVDARAYTVGHNIVFGRGEYSPETGEGRRLLAHELAHVTQQRSLGRGLQSGLTIGPPGDAYERDADRVASQIINHEPFGAPSQASRHEGYQSGGTGFERFSSRGFTKAAPALAGGTKGATFALAQRETNLGAPGAVVRRVPIGEAIERFFGGGTYSDEELLEYLKLIDEKGIEDDVDSDNKARAIVQKWKKGTSSFVLSPRRCMLLIKEMQEEATFDDDEQAILEILERSSNPALSEIFGANGIGPKDLNSDFDGEEFDRLQDFYDRRLGGRTNALAGKITPKGEPVPLGAELGKAVKADAEEKAQPAEACTIKEPEKCPSYEGWLTLFNRLPTYVSRVTGHRVLGPGAAPAATATDPAADPGARRPTVLHRSEDYMPTDRFIDGPTDKWVRDNLPPNLVETAYQLPSDCADIAVILRHVWLAAHKRVELYNGWVCGSTKGAARSKDINELIVMEVFTGSVKGMVNPYSDESGSPVLSFHVLQHVLHPGDILVWKHPGGGGHTHTIINIVRDDQGKITNITALQGNQPISKDQATALIKQDVETQKKKKDPKTKLKTPSEEDLRAAPGRRIEIDDDVELGKGTGVWTWSDGTTLVAAGPPAAAARPKPIATKGKTAVRQLTDWIEPLQKATFDNLESTFESALLEARATIESKKTVSAQDAKALGQAAGDRLKQLTAKAGDLGAETQYYRLKRIRAQIKALRDASHAPETKKVFDIIDEALHLAARGIASVDFKRAAKEGERVVNVLMTGFDPFNPQDPSKPPRAGDWNPSGAAVLALDNETIDVDKQLKAAVEGVVLPVSFREFDKGLVESIVKQHQNADAVITVSLDPNIPPEGLIDIEQFAVGVHTLDNGKLEAVPGVQSAQDTGPAIIETDAEKAGPTKKEAKAEGFEFTTDTGIVFEFANKDVADAALAALKLKPQGRAEVKISDVTALREIIKTTARDVSPKSPGITFKAGGQSFAAHIKEGPGGSYLSNEVSYRVLRLLAESPGKNKPPSFHVHTPSGTEGAKELPKNEGTPDSEKARAKAVGQAQTMLTKLIGTLRKLVKVVAKKLTTTGGK